MVGKSGCVFCAALLIVCSFLVAVARVAGSCVAVLLCKVRSGAELQNRRSTVRCLAKVLGCTMCVQLQWVLEVLTVAVWHVACAG